MVNPYQIEGPAIVSFSGGRTSGFMLRQILDAHGGALPDDVRAVFANTGKERTETLDFVRDVSERWSVPIVWLERRRQDPAAPSSFAIVDHATASRDGEPFADLIRERSYLPNPVTRFCTSELKVRPMSKWAEAHGWAADGWTNVIGLRADEPHRIARMDPSAGGRNRDGRFDTYCPMGKAGHVLADVAAFWELQPFDLRLRPWEGNCDLCFLKGTAKRQRIMYDRPDLAAWWIEQEGRLTDRKGRPATFRIDTPSYARLADVTRRQLRLPMIDAAACDPTDLGDCVCTD
jgi:hypothetical protein